MIVEIYEMVQDLPSSETRQLSYLDRRNYRRYEDELRGKLGLGCSYGDLPAYINVLGTQFNLKSASFLDKIDRKGGVKNWLHDIFKSKACRYAVKFGDNLTPNLCQ